MAHKAFQLFCSFFLIGRTVLSESSALLAQETTPSKIAMWKVQSSQSTVYLLGSIHVGKSCTLDSPRIAAAMADAEHTVFEIDFTQVTPEDTRQLALELAAVGRLRPGDRTLKDSVDVATYDQIRQKFEQLKPPGLGISLDTLNQIYRPAFIALQIQGFQIMNQGINGDCGVDKLLINQAQAAQKNILALETFQEQSALIKTIMQSIPEHNVEQKFQAILSETDNDTVSTLLTSVMNGDLDSLQNKVIESCQETPTLCYKMLDERNMSWMNQINTYLQDPDDYFIIVGAAHLIGPNSLITLLQKANYRVEPF